MPAIPVHHTATVDQPWDGPAAVARLKPDDDPAFLATFAWYDGTAPDPDKDGYPDAKSDWKFPHHEVAPDGAPGAANLNGVRNAMSRLPQADIPASDRAAVERHLQAHLDDAKRSFGDTMVERRYTPGAEGKLELRSSDGRERIGGYAAVFNRSSRNLGGFTEVVDPVAFNQSRGDGWPGVMARYNHSELIGTTSAGTLQLRTDSYGLLYEVEPPKSRSYVTELVQRGDVTKSSFAFRTISDDWSYEDGLPRRTLLGVHLVDVAPVDDPAYSDTSVGLRAAPETVEAALRSLAARMSADVDEVRALAMDNELRKFFVRSDGGSGQPARPKPKKGMFGPAAAAALLARREDPYV